MLRKIKKVKMNKLLFTTYFSISEIGIVAFT